MSYTCSLIRTLSGELILIDLVTIGDIFRQLGHLGLWFPPNFIPHKWLSYAQLPNRFVTCR